MIDSPSDTPNPDTEIRKDVSFSKTELVTLLNCAALGVALVAFHRDPGPRSERVIEKIGPHADKALERMSIPTWNTFMQNLVNTLTKEFDFTGTKLRAMDVEIAELLDASGEESDADKRQAAVYRAVARLEDMLRQSADRTERGKSDLH